MGNGTPIGRVRGLGAAHEGANDWWHHKISAGSNLAGVVVPDLDRAAAVL